jgi:hypothetical protein
MIAETKRDDVLIITEVAWVGILENKTIAQGGGEMVHQLIGEVQPESIPVVGLGKGAGGIVEIFPKEIRAHVEE